MNPSRLNARLFHRPADVLATAVDEDWLHTDGFKKEHICQKCSHLVRILQSAPAEFDDDVDEDDQDDDEDDFMDNGIKN